MREKNTGNFELAAMSAGQTQACHKSCKAEGQRPDSLRWSWDWAVYYTNRSSRVLFIWQ